MNYKKIIAAAMCLCITAPLASNMLTAGAEEYSPTGDINGDGDFSVSDVVSLKSYLLGLGDLTDWQNGDLCQDGVIDVFDYNLMLKQLQENFPEYTFPIPFIADNLCEGYEAAEVTGAEADEEFILGQTEFALSLLQNLYTEEENTLISPYSVMQALAMTANGADNYTKTEMENVLGGMSIDRLNEYLYTQRTSQQNDEYAKLSTANSIWTIDDEERIQLIPEFIQTNMNYYDADMFKAPFDQTTVNDINSWVKEKTDEMVPKIIDEEINYNQVMFLINAIAFDAKWEEQYEEYQVSKHDFTDIYGNIQQAEMLNSVESYYIGDDNAVGLYKYYKGRKYAFAALMPNEGIQLNDYIAELTAETLNEILSNPQNTAIKAGIPKFTYDYSTDMAQQLSDMGMPTAFTPYADFTKMAKTRTGYLYIGSVLHKTHIELSESGTKAAAVTVVTMEDCAAPLLEKEVILDRPFVYFIVDTETDLPVFMGTLTEIPEK